jgi:hypothetical protein
MAVDTTLAALRSAAKGLLFTSESDSTLRAFLWRRADIGAETVEPETLRRVKNLPADLSIAALPIEKLFAPMTTPQAWHGEEERESVAGFTALVRLLRGLNDPQAFRVGSGPDITAYALGKTDTGDIAGVWFTLTET